MNNIKQLTDSELDEIISGSVDGVYPTSQEVSMAQEVKRWRSVEASLAQVLSNERLLHHLAQFDGAAKEAAEIEDDGYATECTDISGVIRELLSRRQAECEQEPVAEGCRVIPLDALGAACGALQKYAPDSNTLKLLRRYTFGDLSNQSMHPEPPIPDEVPKGWKLVPTTATPAMARAGGKAAREYLLENGGNSPYVIYEAMVAAAPKEV
ncbi:hypothetical protein CBW58_02075 [Yersinia frederiksenii]|nr:hypothetical protein CBW58_02075 [Yersinia frederiksenii]